MAKKLSKQGVELNKPVLPFQVSQSVDAFTGADDYDITISGSLTVTGSITGTPGTINILTASYATSASYAISASVEIIKEISSSNADTASSANNFIIRKDLTVNGNSEFIGSITASSISASGNITASGILGTASFATNAATASSADGFIVRNNLTVNGGSEFISSITASSISASGNITASSFTGDLTGDVTGNVIGDVTGDLTGDVTGDVTGDLTGDVTGDVTGDLTGTASKAENLTGTPSIEVTNITASGDISASGNITASVFKGSGKGLTDVPAGSITGLSLSQIASGSATASISGTEGFRVNTNSEITGSLNIDGNLTSSGNISASGTISSSGLRIESNGLYIESNNLTDFIKLNSLGSSANPIKLIFEKTSGQEGIIEYNRNGDLEIYNTDGDGGVMIDGTISEGGDLYVSNDGNVGIGGGFSKNNTPGEKLEVVGNISASGNITASGFFGTASHAVTASYAINALTASFLDGNVSSAITALTASSANDFIIRGNVTASGDISASGNITASTFKGSGKGLTDIPSSAITGLNLSQISSGSATASISPIKGFEVNTNITASGNISASGNITVVNASASKIQLDDYIIKSGSAGTYFGFAGNNKYVAFTGGNKRLEITNSGVDITGSLDLTGNISTSGDISARSASFTHIVGNSPLTINTGTSNLVIKSNNFNVDSAGDITSGTGKGFLTTNITASNISASGKITAKDLEVINFTSSFITSSTIFTSGSNQLGDAMDDVQTLVGTTKITGSAQITGSVGVSGSMSFQGTENETIINPNSTNGIIFNNTGGGTGDFFRLRNNGVDKITMGIGNAGNEGFFAIYDNSSATIQLRGDAQPSFINKPLHIGGTTSATHQLQVTGDVAISGNITSSTNINASGNVSASGHLFASASQSTEPFSSKIQLAVYNTESGEFMYTASSAIGGKGGGDETLAGKMIYVDKVNGNNATAKTGSLDKPFFTIEEALSQSLSGDTIYVRPGTYAENNLLLPSGISLIGESYETVIIGEGKTGDNVIEINTSDSFIDNITLYPDANIGAGAGLSISASSGNLNIGTIGIKGNSTTGKGIGVIKDGAGTATIETIHVLQGGLLDVVNIVNGEFNSNLSNFPTSSGDVTNFAHLSGSGKGFYPCAKISNLNISSSQVTSAIKSSGGTSGYINKLTLLNPNVCGVTNVLNVQGNYETIKSIGGEFVDVTYALSSSVTTPLNEVGNEAIYSITSQHLPVYSYTPALAYGAEFAIDSLSQKSDLFKSSKNLFGVDQMSVGVAEKNIESYFGKGAPYQTGMVVFTTSGSLQKDIPSQGIFGSTGSNITNVTDKAKSTDGSLFSFQTTRSGDTILFCTQRRLDSTENFEPLQTFGITADIFQRAASNNYVLEVHGQYVEIDPPSAPVTASQWFEVPIQAYSNKLGFVYGNEIFRREQSKETMVFGINASVNWVTSSITPVSSSGVEIPPASRQPVNGYWARFRQVNNVANISDKPSFESFRITSDAVAISDKGLQFQGNAIYQDVQPLDLVHNDDSSGDYAQITIGDNGTTTGFDIPIAEINDGTRPGVRFTLPPGICTAYPIEIEYDILVNDSSDNVITHLATKNPVIYNFTPQGSNKFPQPRSIAEVSPVTESVSSPGSITNDFIISGSANKKIIKHKESFNVSDIFSGDMIITRLRDGVGDFSNDALLLNARAKFLRFALGEYRNPAQPFTLQEQPAPPITLLEELWDNGAAGGTGVLNNVTFGGQTYSGWDTGVSRTTATAPLTSADRNLWVIPDPADLPTTASSDGDPVDRTLTTEYPDLPSNPRTACYITNDSGSTNRYEYYEQEPGGDNVNGYSTAFCFINIPASVVNVEITASYKCEGESSFDFGLIGIAPTSSFLSVNNVNQLSGSYFDGISSPAIPWNNERSSNEEGDQRAISITGPDEDDFRLNLTPGTGTQFSRKSIPVNEISGGPGSIRNWDTGVNIVMLGWNNDYGGGSNDNPPISIGYIKIVGKKS